MVEAGSSCTRPLRIMRALESVGLAHTLPQKLCMWRTMAASTGCLALARDGFKLDVVVSICREALVFDVYY